MITLSKSSPQDIEWLWTVLENRSYISFQIEENSNFSIKNNGEDIATLKLDMSQPNHITFRGIDKVINLLVHFSDTSVLPIGEYDYEIYVKSEIDECFVSENGKIRITE